MRKFALKERASIRALSSLISAQVVGKPLSAALRSYGSMLLLDFGRLTKLVGRKRDYLVGEWTLLIEWPDWTMTVPGRGRVTSNSEEESIDKMLPALARQPVTQLSFTPNGRLMLRLRNGAALSCAGTGGPRRGSRLASWTLSSAAHWNVQFRCHRAFVVEAEYGTREATSSRRIGNS
jgi:hypothetical protein